MFNRQPYNRGKFNISIGETKANGLAQMVLKAKEVSASRIISAHGKTSLNLKDNVNATIYKKATSKTNINLLSEGTGTKNFIVSGDIAKIYITTKADASLTGEQQIKFNNLALNSGEELVINTGDMTITINGQNAMKYLSGDSEFITLINGVNKLIYDDASESRKISFDIIWKDRWL